MAGEWQERCVKKTPTPGHIPVAGGALGLLQSRVLSSRLSFFILRSPETSAFEITILEVRGNLLSRPTRPFSGFNPVSRIPVYSSVRSGALSPPPSSQRLDNCAVLRTESSRPIVVLRMQTPSGARRPR
jgi:hypothetical protein